MPSSEAPVQEVSWFLRHIGWITRVWGIVTVIVIWAAGITHLQRERAEDEADQGDDTEYVGWYLIVIGLVMTFLESTWFINKGGCCQREGCCCSVWRVIMWVDDWKRGVLYILLSIPTFLQGMVVFLSLICGFLIIILAVLYITKTFEYTFIHAGPAGGTEYGSVRTTEPTLPIVPVHLTIEAATQTDNGGVTVVEMPHVPEVLTGAIIVAERHEPHDHRTEDHGGAEKEKLVTDHQ